MPRSHRPWGAFPLPKGAVSLQFPLLADEGAGGSRLASRVPGWGFPAHSAARNKPRRVPDFYFYSYT